MKLFQKGFNYGQDGPGNRLVYHLQGCNMRCIWCSNPEGMTPNGGREYSVEELFSECMRSRLMFFSGGGVTFTGGEASLQHDELLSLLKLLKGANIHTCIETNGTSAKLSELLEWVDYLIMDFKHYDSECLKRYTGIGNETVKQNFEKNCAAGRQQHIRIPLICGINAEHPESFAAYFSEHNTEHTVFEFLPYHEYGKEKWTEAYQVTNGFISKETLKKFREEFTRRGLHIVAT